jgi:peptide/nickel transport system ATP-binding protein
MAVVEIEGLHIAIGSTPILRGVDLAVDEGEVLGLVGESGSGKSMTALSVMQLLPPGAQATGKINFAGRDLLARSEATMCRIRGREIGMVFQEPMTALNPLKTIGEQIAEGLRWHTGASRAGAMDRARALLSRVGLPSDRATASRYPHQLSGGQRQRVVIAIAIACRPKLLIADEPTSALDVTTQAQILDLLRGLVAEERLALLLITHDLAVVAEMADRLAIMKDGEIVETGETSALFRALRHPYSRRLIEASVHVPNRPQMRAEFHRPPLLSVCDVVRAYPLRRMGVFGRKRVLRAVDGVQFTIAEGESVGLVGESGSGKSTLARTLLALEPPSEGEVLFQGENLAALHGPPMREARRKIQAVFQDPFGSFDPRHRIRRIVAEPLHLLPELSARDRRDRVAQALDAVHLSPDIMERYPHEFSGGQRQRIAIARAIITAPKLIIADEPVSALDVSIRAQILDLFAELRDRLNVAYLFISHDLSVVRAITTRVLVMHRGRIVEEGTTEEVLNTPRDAYTRSLVAAAPDLSRALARDPA